MESVFDEMSSWKAATCHTGMKTVCQTKSLKSKYLGIFNIKILNIRGDWENAYLKKNSTTTRNSYNFGFSFAVVIVCCDIESNIFYCPDATLAGPCGFKTLASVLLPCFKRVSHGTHFYKLTRKNSAYSVWLGSGISKLKSLQYNWAREFPDYKNVRLTIYLLISLYATYMVHLCMYTLSMLETNMFKW